MLCSEWVEIWPLYCTSIDDKKQHFLFQEAISSKSGSTASSLQVTQELGVLKEHRDALRQSPCPVLHSSLSRGPGVLLCMLGRAESTAELSLHGQ